MNSVGKGRFIMSENLTEERNRTVLLVVKLDMMENFPRAEVIQAATLSGKVIQLHCSLHSHVAYYSLWEHLVRNPIISDVNILLEDMIAVLSLRNMFLSVSKIGCEGPSTILEDMENWLEFMIGTHFCDLEASPVVQF